MALSVQKLRGSAVSLGFVAVANNGTVASLAVNVDANNANAPGTVFPAPPQFPGTQTEFSGSFRGFHIQGYKPGNNNNGMVVNTGNIYLMQAPSPGGSGNRSDSGAMIAVIAGGADYFFPPDGTGNTRFSPYTLYLDADVNGEGGLVAGYGVEP